jgi:hypothetical protein
MATQAKASTWDRGRWFYVVSAAIIALIIFAGFSRTFYLNQYFAKVDLPPVLVVHGIVFSSWVILLIVQVSLVEAGRTDIHRKLGVAGACLAAVMIVVGVMATIHAGRYGFRVKGLPPPVIFMVVPIFDLIVFSSLVGTGIYYRKKPDVHKRLMLLSTLAILGPGIARLPLAIIARYGVLAIFGLADSVLIGCVLYDTIRNRRLHPAFLWGGLWVVVSLPLRLAVAHTEAWQHFARWLIQ